MSKFKILVCEDEKGSLTAISNILAKNNYEVASAGDGLQAIEQVKEIKPDAILMDIRMPKIDGIEAAKRIRKFDDKVKIIFLSAFKSQELASESAKYGSCDYIVKPASPEKILAAIKSVLPAEK